MVLSVLFWNFVTTWITFCDKHVTSAPRTDHSWSEYCPGEIWRPLLQNHPSLLWQKLTFSLFLCLIFVWIGLRLLWDLFQICSRLVQDYLFETNCLRIVPYSICQCSIIVWKGSLPIWSFCYFCEKCFTKETLSLFSHFDI